jgi:hypothetical protein
MSKTLLNLLHPEVCANTSGLFAVVQLASESATGEYSARALSRVCEGRTIFQTLLEKVNLLWGNLFSFSPQEVKKLKQAQREKRLVALNKILAQSPESLEVYVRAALALGVLALAQVRLMWRRLSAGSRSRWEGAGASDLRCSRARANIDYTFTQPYGASGRGPKTLP